MAIAGTLMRVLATGAAPIDREALVQRHAVVLQEPDAWSPLSVGNGEFAFTADVTGLQTFPEHYRRSIPLSTQSQWGWHSFPNPQNHQLPATFTQYESGGRTATYPTATRSAAGQWLRENPHRLDLAQIGFTLPDGGAVALGDLTAIEQRLDLWTGTLDSRFSVKGVPVHVLTRAHPVRDMIAVRIEVPGGGAAVAVKLAFPYGAAVHTGDPADWSRPERHRTIATSESRRQVAWRRELDENRYFVRAEWSQGGELRKLADHQYLLTFRGKALEFAVEFSQVPETGGRLPSVAATEKAARMHWAGFWRRGGAVDLSGTKDPRARELERRIVLSQYLTALQCAGSMPPQETGLTFNSWYGKFHLEMHWWHAAHFALWGRPGLLEKSLAWYRTILPEAKATAERQGYAGVRWPKMTGPNGVESPSDIGPLLIWQQPHLIHMLELLYRGNRDRRFLEKYRDLVFPTADFMASFARWEEQKGRYVLGPPLIPAQEIHPARTTFNSTFELEYWRWGLETAQQWRERLGMPREANWQRVIERLSPLPVRDGLYVNAESDPQTFHDLAKRRDHPSLLGAMGILPGKGVDRETMRRTLQAVMAQWQWPQTWGWDYPMTAMTAARVGDPGIAVDALLMDVTKNRYLKNGHNYQREGLTIYLPGNGGLLAAVAMMAAGWDGSPTTAAPGFPSDWVVRFEGLARLP